MPATWTDTLDRKLLLIIIQLLSPSPPKWDEVSKMMGEGYSSEAVRQHYQKLRRESQKSSDSADSSPTKSTPIKNKTPRKRMAEPECVDDEEDCKCDASPSKKPKKVGGKEIKEEQLAELE